MLRNNGRDSHAVVVPDRLESVSDGDDRAAIEGLPDLEKHGERVSDQNTLEYSDTYLRTCRPS